MYNKEFFYCYFQTIDVNKIVLNGVSNNTLLINRETKKSKKKYKKG